MCVYLQLQIVKSNSIEMSVFPGRSHLFDVAHRFSACNIEKLGVAWSQEKGVLYIYDSSIDLFFAASLFAVCVTQGTLTTITALEYDVGT